MKITLKICIYTHVLALFKRGDLTIEKLAPYLHYQTRVSEHDVVIGEVEVDIDLVPEDEIVGAAVIALRAQAKAIRAKAADEARAIEGKVQQLLSIENNPTKEG